MSCGPCRRGGGCGGEGADVVEDGGWCRQFGFEPHDIFGEDGVACFELADALVAFGNRAVELVNHRLAFGGFLLKPGAVAHRFFDIVDDVGGTADELGNHGFGVAEMFRVDDGHRYLLQRSRRPNGELRNAHQRAARGMMKASTTAVTAMKPMSPPGRRSSSAVATCRAPKLSAMRDGDGVGAGIGVDEGEGVANLNAGEGVGGGAGNGDGDGEGVAEGGGGDGENA